METNNYRIYTEQRLNELGLWWRARPNHKNSEAFSCRQAVTIRDRLGSGDFMGVPLWTELKSRIGFCTESTSNNVHYYAAHSRGNCCFDENRIAQALSLNPNECTHTSIVDDTSGESSLPAQLSDSDIFGLVNPLNIEVLLADLGQDKGLGNLVHIFDRSLTIEDGYPRTVTTNIGERSAAVELNPNLLIQALSDTDANCVIADVSYPDPVWLGQAGENRKDYWASFPPASGPKIGILTGNSPESGLTLWQDFLDIYRKCYDRTADVLMPEVAILSLPQMGLTMELIEREEEAWSHIEHALNELLDAGCKILTVACNTTIYFEPKIRKLCEPYGARFVSIAEACIATVTKKLSEAKSDSPKVGILGIGPVIHMEQGYSGYEQHFAAGKIDAVPFEGTDIAYSMKNLGTDKRKINQAVNKFRKLIREQFQEDDILILALTEVSLAYRRHLETAPKKVTRFDNFIDPLFELAKFLVFNYAAMGYRKATICQMPDSYPVEESITKIFERRLGKYKS